MLMKDRETDSYWSCYNGAALYGSLRGKALHRIPAFLCQLGEWLREHPDSEILEWSPHPHHADPRHGHGSWFHFGGRGQHPHAEATMLSDQLDDRLPESEVVLGVCHRGGTIAYPLSEVHRQGCVVADTLADEPVVVWARSQASAWMGAYSRRYDGETLEFEAVAEGRFRDRGGSIWTVEGLAVAGPRSGESLTPLDFVSVKWNAWAGFYPTTTVYRAPSSSRPGIAIGEFQPLLDALSGYRIEITSELLTGSLPPAAHRGLAVRIENDPFLIYHFPDSGRAQDFAGSRLLTPRDRFNSFFAGESRSDLQRHATTVGCFVLESNPDRQYSDLAALERLPEGEIQWSPLLGSPEFHHALAAVPTEVAREPAFGQLFAALDAAGYEAYQVKPMLRQWLPATASDGYSTEIRGDRFLIYRFDHRETAAAYHGERHHTLQAGPFVLRSDPPDQYHVHTEQTYDRPIDEVSWSRLLDDSRFIDAARAVG